MNKKVIVTLSVFLFCLASLTFIYAYEQREMKAVYYYNPMCSHCNSIENFMLDLSKDYNIEWVDTSEPKSYPIKSTPTLIIKASDGRDVYLIGSHEIYNYATCELNEQSTKECMTTGKLNEETNSYFIR